MKEHPILFSAPMVRALLDGSKTQTRRIMTPDGKYRLEQVAPTDGGPPRCPYGWPGDRLWVRETFQRFTDDGEIIYKADSKSFETMNDLKRDGCLEARWRPSIHMPRWASRILLEVTDVSAERLQDISEDDALAEGIVHLPRMEGFGLPDGSHYHGTDPRISYWSLWDSINGAGSVEANPWVWCVSFRRIAP